MQKIIGILSIMLLLTGCSASRKAAIKDTGKGAEKLSLSEIENRNLKNVNFDIIRADIKYTDEERDEELIAGISYRKDRQYLISLRTKAGFEIGRIFITQDTILANDRLNRKLYYGSPLLFERKYGIELSWLPIVFGDLVTAEENKDVVVECINNEGRLEKKLSSGILVYTIDCNEGKTSLINVEKTYGKGIILSFRNFIDENVCKYPSEIEITDNESDSKISIRIRKAEINTSRMIRFIPGEGYERILLK